MNWYKYLKTVEGEIPLKDKPPLGVMPQSIWLEKRYDDLTCAIDRYLEKDLSVPNRWFEWKYDVLMDMYRIGGKQNE